MRTLATMRALRALTAGTLRAPEEAYNNQGASCPDGRRAPRAGESVPEKLCWNGGTKQIF